MPGWRSIGAVVTRVEDHTQVTTTKYQLPASTNGENGKNDVQSTIGVQGNAWGNAIPRALRKYIHV